MQQVINSTQTPRLQTLETSSTLTTRLTDSPRAENPLQLPLYGGDDNKGKVRDQDTDRSNYITSSNSSSASGFGGRFLNRSKSFSVNRDPNERSDLRIDARRDSRAESRDSRDNRQRDRANSMDIDRNQDQRKSGVSDSNGMTMSILQAAHYLAATTQQAQQLQPSANSLNHLPTIPGLGMMSTANSNAQLQANNLFPNTANLMSFPNGPASNVDQNQQDLFVQQHKFQQQQLANISALAQPGFVFNDATSIPPLSPMLLDDSEKLIDYRQFLMTGQISHQIVRQVFQTPITPLDLDPTSTFSAPLAITLSHHQRLQQMSRRYSESIDRLFQELIARNATLGLSRDIWEKLAKRQYIEISQFHPDRLLETPPLPRNLRVQLIPDTDGNLRLSFIDEVENPLSALAQTFSSSTLLSATSHQQQHVDIKGFAGWFRAWNRYTTARTILFSEDFTQLKQYALTISGFAELYRWGNVQRFDNARRTVHAVDPHDTLTNDIPTIRAQCLVPEARLDVVPSVQAQNFLDGFNKTNDRNRDGNNQLKINTNVSTTNYTSPRSTGSSYRPDYRSNAPTSPNGRTNFDSQTNSRSRISVVKPKTSTSGRVIPQSGSINNIQICGEFNGRRGCARKHCSYLHICAVCAGTDHGRSTCAGKTSDPYPVPAASIRRNEERDSLSPQQRQSAQEPSGWRLML